MERSSYTSSSMSYSSSSSTSGAQSNSQSNFQSQAHQSYSDGQGNTWTSSASSNPSGTTIHDSHKSANGQETRQTTRLDSGGRQIDGGERGRIEDVSDQAEADRLYEERIEDEYAKREGGA